MPFPAGGIPTARSPVLPPAGAMGLSLRPGHAGLTVSRRYFKQAGSLRADIVPGPFICYPRPMPVTDFLPPLPLLPHPLDGLPAAINHMLAAEPWARAQLAPHANKTLHVVVAPFTVQLSVAPNGTVARAAAGCVPDVTVTLASSALSRVLAGGTDAVMRDMRLEGDAEFAQAVSLVARQLRWDVEEDLSKVVGDAAAHRVVEGARAVAARVSETHEKFAANVSEYLLEENPHLIRPRAVRAFADSVRVLRDDLARLEKRVDRLSRNVTRDASST